MVAHNTLFVDVFHSHSHQISTNPYLSIKNEPYILIFLALHVACGMEANSSDRAQLIRWRTRAGSKLVILNQIPTFLAWENSVS